MICFPLQKDSHCVIFRYKKNAYDNVNIKLLCQKLENIKIPNNFINIIMTLTQNRKVILNDNNSEPRIVYTGLPQGAVLSPILFNLYTTDLESVVVPGVFILQLAEDFCIFTTSHSIEENNI